MKEKDEDSRYGQSYYSRQDSYDGDFGNYSYYGTEEHYRQNERRSEDPKDGGKKGDKKKKKKKKKKKSKVWFVIRLIILIIAALVIAGIVYLGRLDRESLKNILINSGVSESGYQNIAVFGVDSREGQLESGTRSDTIIIASINKKTGDIKLVSVYRDTYLDNTDGYYRKATEAFANGGASLAVNMLNKNLDLDIEDYVTVDFEAVIEVVDELGGIEIDLTDEEVKWLNAYLVETSEVTGRSYTEVASAGTQTLTGIQAMAYCRIRYTEGWDYRRTERQREVFTQIFKKAQEQGIVSLVKVVNNMMPYISTSLSNTELLSMAAGISKYSIADSRGFPFENTTAMIGSADCVIPVNLENNVKELHELLYGITDYTPSETVSQISNYIISMTGIS